jgi:hypothetical protein
MAAIDIDTDGVKAGTSLHHQLTASPWSPVRFENWLHHDRSEPGHPQESTGHFGRQYSHNRAFRYSNEIIRGVATARSADKTEALRATQTGNHMDVAPFAKGASRGMYVIERRQMLLERARRTGRVDVAQVSKELSLAPETIRRDLKDLEQQGLVRRVSAPSCA